MKNRIRIVQVESNGVSLEAFLNGASVNNEITRPYNGQVIPINSAVANRMRA
ncbi:hypothetical protein [Flagellimonas flava]|uniref:hypothetical protein n=1 Tax=Flagellimonas flava TaxID=570519 RepID=UPI003D6509EC